jgi:hypothetical protein
VCEVLKEWQKARDKQMPEYVVGDEQTSAEVKSDEKRREALQETVRNRYGRLMSIGSGVETASTRRYDVMGDFSYSPTVSNMAVLERKCGRGCRVIWSKVRGTDGMKMIVEVPKFYKKRMSVCEALGVLAGSVCVLWGLFNLYS